MTQFQTAVETLASYAAGFNLGLTFYEGGYSPDYYASWDTAHANHNALRAASKQVEEIHYLTRRVYDICTGAGGEFPSVFNLSGPGAWSALDPNIYAESPTWSAIRLYAQGKRRLRLT